MKSTIRPGRSSCIVSSIAEKPIDSSAETMQGSPAQGGNKLIALPLYRAVHMSPYEPGHHGWRNLSASYTGEKSRKECGPSQASGETPRNRGGSRTKL
jgi:hypothetical protein